MKSLQKLGTSTEFYAIDASEQLIKHLCFICGITQYTLSPVFETILETWESLKIFKRLGWENFFLERLRQWFSALAAH